MQVGKPLQDAEVETPKLEPCDVLVRVAACGICHSDAHYRGGISPVAHLPLTLGHEVAGRVEAVGSEVTHVSPQDRVYVHYLVNCGHCYFCRRGHEQFCVQGQMIESIATVVTPSLSKSLVEM
jgi:D-arabinose 1-dehydrogenase-like Zn-dependent alcohol dehydrogenase